MEETDFLEGGAVSGTALSEVMGYVEALQRVQADIENTEGLLAALKAQEKHLAEDTIPQVLGSNGLDELKLSNGKKVSIRESLYCRLPEDTLKREEALRWLEENGGADKIKDEVTISDVNPGILDELAGIGVPYSRRRSVHPATLQSWFKENLGYKKGFVARLNPEDVPKEFGVYMRKEAKIS